MRDLAAFSPLSSMLASLVPIAVSLLLLLVPKGELFDFSILAQQVRNLEG